MITISKEAKDAATRELVWSSPYSSIRKELGFHVQLLLDAQKSESEKVIAQLKGEYANERKFALTLRDECNKLVTTITALRAACAENDEALRGIKALVSASSAIDRIANQALSSHGESILAEIARLKEDARLNELAFFDQNTKFLKCIEEKEALRARADSAEKELEKRNVAERIGIPPDLRKAIDSAFSQPPQQGDKAP
jgi:hypothetical protein